MDPPAPSPAPAPRRSTAWILVLSLAVWGALGGVLFAVAGRVDLVWVWATLLVFALSHVAMVLLVFRRDPDLVRERLSPGRGVPRWDRVFAAASGVLFLGNLAVTALDVARAEGADDMPLALHGVGLAAIGGGMALMGWAMRANTFFSRVVRIQEERGHRVITSGPYRFVRHPGYLATLLWWSGFQLALGSWLGLAASLAVDALVVWRTAMEDRFLHRALVGYGVYAARVRYRLIPGVW